MSGWTAQSAECLSADSGMGLKVISQLGLTTSEVIDHVIIPKVIRNLLLLQSPVTGKNIRTKYLAAFK